MSELKFLQDSDPLIAEGFEDLSQIGYSDFLSQIATIQSKNSLMVTLNDPCDTHSVILRSDLVEVGRHDEHLAIFGSQLRLSFPFSDTPPVAEVEMIDFDPDSKDASVRAISLPVNVEMKEESPFTETARRVLNSNPARFERIKAEKGDLYRRVDGTEGVGFEPTQDTNVYFTQGDQFAYSRSPDKLNIYGAISINAGSYLRLGDDNVESAIINETAREFILPDHFTSFDVNYRGNVDRVVIKDGKLISIQSGATPDLSKSLDELKAEAIEHSLELLEYAGITEHDFPVITDQEVHRFIAGQIRWEDVTDNFIAENATKLTAQMLGYDHGEVRRAAKLILNEAANSESEGFIIKATGLSEVMNYLHANYDSRVRTAGMLIGPDDLIKEVNF